MISIVKNSIRYMAALIGVLLLLGTTTVSAKSLEAFFSYCTFNSPQTGPYIETYLNMKGSSLNYTQLENGAWQGSVEVTYIFKQGEEIKNFKKFNLLSPEVADTLEGFINFMDQQRIQLPNGKYTFEISLTDQNNLKSHFVTAQDIAINYPTDDMSISEVQLVESYEKTEAPNILTKSGYDLVPYVTDFYPASKERLIFYAEVYNTDKAMGADEMYLINYYLESTNNEGKALDGFRGFARQSARAVNVLLQEFNMANLASGNYNLVIEVRNRQNELLRIQKIFIQRSNPTVPLTREELTNLDVAATFVTKITDRDTIVDYIKSLRPISSELEVAFADNNLKEAEIELLQQFFLGFWTNRNVVDPEAEWNRYHEQVRKVNREFSTSITKGYATDRGRIYLKYGQPNTIAARRNEPSTYPYEIWHYYRLPIRSDAKFIFYSPDLVTNEYQLLHSNVRGEVNDFRWQLRLRYRIEQLNNIDETQGIESFGSEADDLWRNPR
ncbi:MAG: GWxTD domain-containing protein [Salibacteraceae bacterium]